MRGIIIGLLLGVGLGLLAGFVVWGRSTTAPEASVAEADRTRIVPPTEQLEVTPPVATESAARGEKPLPVRSPPTSEASPPEGDATTGRDLTRGGRARELLAALRRAADGDQTVSVSRTLSQLVKHAPTTHVPLELTLSLIRAGFDFKASEAVYGLPESELRTILRAGTSATPGDRASWFLVIAAARRLRMRQVQIETVRALLVHELATVRRAGLFRAASAQSSTESLVRSIAIADPDGEVRSAAIDLLVEWDLEHGETLSLEVGAIVKRAMRDGDLRTRRETACYVEDLGVEGPRFALDLLIDEGLADDEEILEYLVEVAVLGGLGDELLTRLPTRAVRRQFKDCVWELHEETPDTLAALAPRFPEVERSLDPKQRAEFLNLLARTGHHEYVAEVLHDPGRDGMTRRAAFEALRDFVSENEPRSIFWDAARRVVSDATQDQKLRQRALDALADDYEPRTDVFDLQRTIIRDHATPAALRAGAVEGLADEWEDEDLERAWPAIVAVWKEAAERDPSAIVRATAQSMLKETRE